MSKPHLFLSVLIAPGAGFSWQAPPGEEIIDPIAKEKIWKIKYYNATNSIQNIQITRNPNTLSIEYSHSNIVPWTIPLNSLNEKEKPILPEPEFSLDEIELGRKLVDRDAN